MSKKGTVYFFTGLAGAGKTTIGGLLYRREQKGLYTTGRSEVVGVDLP